MINFSKLKLNGALVTRLEIVPAKKLSLSLVIERVEPGQYLQEYDLHFTGLRNVQIDFASDLWISIKNIRSLAGSPFLKRHKKLIATRGGNIIDIPVQHFRISCEGGKIDVLAVDIVLVDVERISPASITKS